MHQFFRMSNWISKSLLFAFLLSAISLPVSAETLQLSMPATVSKNLPRIAERIIRALQGTGYNIEIVNIPNQRSLMLLTQGKVAIESLRASMVAENFPDLVAIHPPVMSLVFKMVTSAKTPKICEVSEGEFDNLSVAGVLGVGLHKFHYFPKFGHATELSDTPSVLKFVALQRADVTFLPDQSFSLLPAEIMDSLYVCSSHQTKFNFHTHIHQDYLWAKEKIEAAYREEFGTDQN